MKNWKRVVSLFLAFLLMVTAGPLPIYGEEEPAKPKYKVTFTDDYGTESEPQEVEEGASAQIPVDFEPDPGELITAITDEEGNKKNPSAPIFRDENFTIEYGDQVDVTLSVVGDERHNGSKGYKDQIIEPTKVTITSQDLEIQDAQGYPTNKRYGPDSRLSGSRLSVLRCSDSRLSDWRCSDLRCSDPLSMSDLISPSESLPAPLSLTHCYLQLLSYD